MDKQKYTITIRDSVTKNSLSSKLLLAAGGGGTTRCTRSGLISPRLSAAAVVAGIVAAAAWLPDSSSSETESESLYGFMYCINFGHIVSANGTCLNVYLCMVDLINDIIKLWHTS